MKKIFLTMVVFAVAFSTLISQEKTSDVPERLKYYKEKYEETFEVPFEEVWKTVKETITGIGAQVAQQKNSQNDEGLWKGTIHTDNYIFTEGSDSTYRILQRYQYNMKYIPGGIWVNGRINYKIILKEVKANLVEMTLTSELSAREDHVTEEYHYWKSNGILEKQFIDNLKERLEKKSKK